MEDDKPLGIWEIIKGVYFFVLTWAGAFALANLVFPFHEGSDGGYGFLLAIGLWIIFFQLHQHEIENAFWHGGHRK